jgi:hypothetical protein
VGEIGDKTDFKTRGTIVKQKLVLVATLAFSLSCGGGEGDGAGSRTLIQKKSLTRW